MQTRSLLLSLFISIAYLSVSTASPVAVSSVHKNSDGVTLEMKPGTLRLEVFSPSIIRVTYGLSNSLPTDKSFAVIGKPERTQWKLDEMKDEISLRTDEIEARVNRTNGSVGFFDKDGKLLLAETADGGKSLTPSRVANVDTLQSWQKFDLPPGEAIYGLGQHTLGVFDYRGSTVQLMQKNPTESAVPVLVSSRGYGVLWDNPAVTEVNVGTGGQEIIPSAQLDTEDGQHDGLTARYYRGENFDTLVATRTNAQVDFDWTTTPPADLPHDHYSIRWTGFIEAKQAGTYTLFASSDDGVRLWVDDKLVIDAWNERSVQTDSAEVKFAANSRHHIRMEYFQATGEAVASLAWQLPTKNGTVAWTSEAADTIDYYFMYGPELDKVVADYRDLTGAAPMFGRWAWGLWQCREHYASQAQLLQVADWYRTHQVPLDGVIQDWQYWTPHPWGSHEFDTNRYPDMAAAIRQLHAENVHILISVWPRFDEGTYSNYVQLKNAGALYPEIVNRNEHFYDPFNPVGRKLYWQQISRELFVDDFDGWWLDASEPELNTQWGEFRDYKTAAGPGVKVYNAYPLMHSTAVHDGQRAENFDKRVFILTRSAYAGQQRNGAVTWSGDIHGTWSVFREQIPAGLNFSISGIPYWNTDTGGFFGGNPRDPAYAELFTRWFQFSAFCPMFRIHGTGAPKEIWRFDDATQKILIAFDQLRYHLLPYIYSDSWRVTSRGDTMMRPLVMDFRSDTNVFDIPDQYMFGPALMANPVTQAGATNRSVYLPAGTTWFDFWTGKSCSGGQTIEAAAPIETMPLFVRAGSILPYGPSIQYAMEGDDPMELRIYRGADGAFTLYEDEGDNYDYEKGIYATIPFTWNDKTGTLEIGKRHGSFPGMLKKRTFRIVWVSPDHGAGIPTTPTPDKVVTYDGSALQVSAP